MALRNDVPAESGTKDGDHETNEPARRHWDLIWLNWSVLSPHVFIIYFKRNEMFIVCCQLIFDL